MDAIDHLEAALKILRPSEGDTDASLLRIMNGSKKNALLKWLCKYDNVTLENLARAIGRDTDWIEKKLGLDKIDIRCLEALRYGLIGVVNAYTLTKLPLRLQYGYFDEAKNLHPAEFAPIVSLRARNDNLH